jgi:hypothetical protein
MWQPDGWEVRTRIGVLTPHADVGPESEIRAMAPQKWACTPLGSHFGAMATGGAKDPTIPLAPIAAFVEPPHIDDAVSLLAAAPVAVIGIGFTSSAYVTGADAEKDPGRQTPGPQFRHTGGRHLRSGCSSASPPRSRQNHRRRSAVVRQGAQPTRCRVFSLTE